MEQDKKLRREIANSNERRRMQSINAGFQSLRNLLPHHEGEKLSKAAILQQTSEYIYHLEQEKNKVVSQNSHLKRLVSSVSGGAGGTGGAQNSSGSEGGCSSPNSPAVVDIPPTVAKRRKTVDGVVESADEGIGSMSPEHSGSNEEMLSELHELRRETMDLRLQLERERRHRIGLEEYIGMLQQQHQQTQQQSLNAIKYETDEIKDDSQVENVEEVETFQPAQQQTVRIIHDETPRCYTIRNNLETIVEAIRHLEGDHLFSDDRNNSTPSSSPASASPGRMDTSPGHSPTHQPTTFSCIVFNPSRPPTRQM